MLGAEQKIFALGDAFAMTRHDNQYGEARRDGWGPKMGVDVEEGGCLARTKTNKSHAKVDEEKWGEEEGGCVQE